MFLKALFIISLTSILSFVSCISFILLSSFCSLFSFLSLSSFSFYILFSSSLHSSSFIFCPSTFNADFLTFDIIFLMSTYTLFLFNVFKMLYNEVSPFSSKNLFPAYLYESNICLITYETFVLFL